MRESRVLSRLVPGLEITRAATTAVAGDNRASARSRLSERINNAGTLGALAEKRTNGVGNKAKGFAEPNSVVIAESTRKLLGNLFELEDLGARDLKGIAGPVRAWRALRPTAHCKPVWALPPGWSWCDQHADCYGLSDAVHKISSGIAAWRSTEATAFVPFYLSCLARAYAQLGQLEEARRAIGEAITTIEGTNENWFEAEINRTAGEIALKSPEPDAAKAAGYFERALSVARKQQAKSWELRAAKSMARLWRDQGKRDKARDLLVPVYGWFTEGFDTLDLKEAKTLLDALAP